MTVLEIGRCLCVCHTQPGVMHCMPCCEGQCPGCRHWFLQGLEAHRQTCCPGMSDKSPFLDALEEMGQDTVQQPALRAVNDFTRRKMFRLYHIPAKYIFSGDTEARSLLTKELGQQGYISLDREGEPCVLSGNPPAYNPSTPESSPIDQHTQGNDPPSASDADQRHDLPADR